MITKLKQSNINIYYNELYIKNELLNITNTINLFNKLITDNNIPFNEYIDILNTLYKIEITNHDLIKISSLIFSNTSKTTILHTNEIYTITKQIEDDHNFHYIEENHNLNIHISFINDKDIDYNHTYTIEEINNLINNKKIILLDLVIDEDPKYNNTNKLIPLSNITSNNFIKIKLVKEEYIPAVTKFLKNYFTKEKLKQELSTYITITKHKLNSLEETLNNIHKNYIVKENSYSEIKSICKEVKKKIRS